MSDDLSWVQRLLVNGGPHNNFILPTYLYVHKKAFNFLYYKHNVILNSNVPM